MLVLSRAVGQSIMIGDGIEVVIVDIRGEKVRLGIQAPNTVSVHRKEVFLAIQEERRGRRKHSPSRTTPTPINRPWRQATPQG